MTDNDRIVFDYIIYNCLYLITKTKNARNKQSPLLRLSRVDETDTR